MKYRRLTFVELHALEKDFVHFLIIQGYDAPAWQKLKENDHAKADELVNLFSDVVFDDLVHRIEYLEYFDKDGLKLFKCEAEHILLTGIIPPFPFETLPDMLEYVKEQPQKFQIYHTSKAYKPDKETEVFRMIQAGALVSDGKYYTTFTYLKTS
jgi:hypothetical protein